MGVSVIMFVYAWNQYLWPLMIINAKACIAQVGRVCFAARRSHRWQWPGLMVMTGSYADPVPSLALLVLFRRQLLETFTIQQK